MNDQYRAFVRGGPKYDATPLEGKINRLTGTLTLADTVTKILVPAFDVRRLNTVTFSSYDAPEMLKPHKKHYLSDVCLGTTAAPTYFRPHHFWSHYTDGDRRHPFHLIDGGVGANNPTMLAISRIAREILCGKNPDFEPLEEDQAVDYSKFIVISIGTGSTKEKGRYNADDCLCPLARHRVGPERRPSPNHRHVRPRQRFLGRHTRQHAPRWSEMQELPPHTGSQRGQ